MADEKKSFVMYKDWKSTSDHLTMEERGMLLTAIFEYQTSGTVPCDLSRVLNVAFTPIKQQFDRDHTAYEETRQKRIENGKKGGRPKKPKGLEKNQKVLEEPKGFNENQTKAKKAVNVNGNANVNVNDNVIENGADTKSRLTPTAPPHLSDAEKEALISEGISIAYISDPDRIKRAEDYAKKQNKSVSDVLREWWNVDEKEKQKKGQSPKPTTLNNSLGDSDDLFQTALERSFRETGVYSEAEGGNE